MKPKNNEPAPASAPAREPTQMEAILARQRERQLELPGMPAEYDRAPPTAELAYLSKLGKPLCEVAPGQWVCGTPQWEMPTHVVCRLVPAAEPGAWRLVPDEIPGWVRMTKDIGSRLGLIGLSEQTLRRLMHDFVEHARISPGCIFVNLESLFAHFRATRNDLGKEASFWDARRLAQWRDTIGLESNLGE
jgi:hypothetical protein